MSARPIIDPAEFDRLAAVLREADTICSQRHQEFRTAQEALSAASKAQATAQQDLRAYVSVCAGTRITRIEV